MTHRSRYSSVPAFVTKDGSQIRELMHPHHHPVRNQSVAEAMVEPGHKTALHRHHRSEEVYHITAGRGRMTLGTDIFAVDTGDTVCIPPGTPHCIENTGDVALKILCSCAPAYSHDDTELLA